MSTTEILLLIGILIIPSVLFIVFFIYIRSERYEKKFAQGLYQVSIFGKAVVIPKQTGIQIITVLVLYFWLDMLIPFFFIVPLMVIAAIAIGRGAVKKVNTTDLRGASKTLLDKLSKMQSEIADVRQHVEGLGYHITHKQIELDKKESLRKHLEEEIRKKSNEAKFWSEMNEEERNTFLDVTVSAVSKNSRGTFWWGLLLGFFVNLLASLSWTLLDSPGREDILKQFKSITSIFGQ